MTRPPRGHSPKPRDDLSLSLSASPLTPLKYPTGYYLFGPVL